MNLWLCEHVDFKLSDDLCQNGEFDVLVHNSALSKYRGSPRGVSVSPMHWLNERDLRKYSAEKVSWDRRSRVEISQKLVALCKEPNYSGIDPMFAGAIERLFYHFSQGCFDALALARSHSRFQEGREGVESKLRVIVGGNYRLTELVGLVWWLAVCRRLGFSSGDIEFIWVSRDTNAIRVDGIDKLLDMLSSNSAAKPVIKGLAPESMRMGKEPACIAWVGALRYSHGWGAEIDRRIGDPMDILRITELNCSFYHELPSIELSAGSGVAQESLQQLFQHADTALSGAWYSSSDDDDCFISDHLRFAIEEFFSNGVGPFVLRRLSATVNLLEQNIGSIDVKALFSTTAPFIESIALHEWARRRNVLPVLLPHSWTSSHEFPAVTYKASLTFVRSDFLLPSAHYDPGSLEKEEIASLEAVLSQNSINRKRQTVEINKKYKQFKLLHSFPFGQRWRILLIYIKQVIAAPFIRWHFKQRLGKAGLKVGYLFNYEHYEFTAGLDFNHLFGFIADIGSRLAALSPKGDTVMVMRRKVGWTNLQLLARHIRTFQTDKRPKNLVISPDGMSLEEFGALCDVVLYFQGTSAIPELMSLGVPMVQLTDPNAPTMLDEPYIVLPEEIVPRMNIEEIMNRFHEDTQWLSGLSNLQKRWIATQMAD